MRSPNGLVWEWVGCEIEANGKLVGGKSRRNFIVGLMDTILNFWGEIDAGGELVAGKIEKKVMRSPNGLVWEWVG